MKSGREYSRFDENLPENTRRDSKFLSSSCTFPQHLTMGEKNKNTFLIRNIFGENVGGRSYTIKLFTAVINNKFHPSLIFEATHEPTRVELLMGLHSTAWLLTLKY